MLNGAQRGDQSGQHACRSQQVDAFSIWHVYNNSIKIISLDDGRLANHVQKQTTREESRKAKAF
jgi:hypothetical protein